MGFAEFDALIRGCGDGSFFQSCYVCDLCYFLLGLKKHPKSQGPNVPGHEIF